MRCRSLPVALRCLLPYLHRSTRLIYCVGYAVTGLLVYYHTASPRASSPPRSRTLHTAFYRTSVYCLLFTGGYATTTYYGLFKLHYFSRSRRTRLAAATRTVRSFVVAYYNLRHTLPPLTTYLWFVGSGDVRRAYVTCHTRVGVIATRSFYVLLHITVRYVPLRRLPCCCCRWHFVETFWFWFCSPVRSLLRSRSVFPFSATLVLPSLVLLPHLPGLPRLTRYLAWFVAIAERKKKKKKEKATIRTFCDVALYLVRTFVLPGSGLPRFYSGTILPDAAAAAYHWDHAGIPCVGHITTCPQQLTALTWFQLV